jgi:hypothetical protein
LVTLAERYGVPADQDITDERWLRDSGERGEVVFMKDARVRFNPAEKAAIVEFRVRGFCLARRDLPAAEMAARFLRSMPRIALACEDDGPFVYAVHEKRIERLALS